METVQTYDTMMGEATAVDVVPPPHDPIAYELAGNAAVAAEKLDDALIALASYHQHNATVKRDGPLANVVLDEVRPLVLQVSQLKAKLDNLVDLHRQYGLIERMVTESLCTEATEVENG